MNERFYFWRPSLPVTGRTMSELVSLIEHSIDLKPLLIFLRFWTIFAPPTYPAQVRRLNVDAQNNIWLGIWAAGRRPGKLAKSDQTTGRITEWTVPRQNASPYDVAQDPDGNIWSADVGGR